MKGRAIVDHLAHCSPEEVEEIQGDFLDEDIMGIEVESWKMNFDGGNKSKRKLNWSSLDFSKKGTNSIFWQTQLSCYKQCHRI